MVARPRTDRSPSGGPVPDSGVDTPHPDLAPRIIGTRSSVPGEDVIDHNGHGTHTASTVAGTGAASGGKERGVAPDADLLVGKVLDNSGSGAMSQIIAGMEAGGRSRRRSRLARWASVFPVNTNATGTYPSRPVAGWIRDHCRKACTAAPRPSATTGRSACRRTSGTTPH